VPGRAARAATVLGPRPADGRLRLLSPASPWVLNDSFPNWPKREPGTANVNVLNPGEESDMGHGTTVHEVTVTTA
jgi:hypothetical protein